MDSIRQALTGLQQLLRRAPNGGSATNAMTISVPGDLATDEIKTIFLDLDERNALYELETGLAEDPRFEHLVTHAGHDRLRIAAHRFACCCVVRAEDQVPGFIEEHSKAPLDLTCFLPVEFLTVEKPVEVFGLRLLPPKHNDVPEPNNWFRLDLPVGSVLCIPVSGTNLALMKNRATESATQKLRALRVALRKDRFVNNMELRFRLAEGYSFGKQGAGWQAGPDVRSSLTLETKLLREVERQPLDLVAKEPSNDLERQAARATKWFEDAMLETDPTVSLLFAFFALESLLGVKDEKRKGEGLAYRRAVLGMIIQEGFANPNLIASLYGGVRSAAVHGSAPEPVPERVANALHWDARRAIVEFLEFGQENGLSKRATLLRQLKNSAEAERLKEGLLEKGETRWEKYFSEEQAPGG